MNTAASAHDIREAIGRKAKAVAPKGSEVILFGSRARGDARPDSDWDVLILLDKERVESSDYDTVTYPIFELGIDLDQMISPIIYTMHDWNSKSFSPFYKNVMHDGIRL